MREQEIMDLYQAALKENIEFRDRISSLMAVANQQYTEIMRLKNELALERDAKTRIKSDLGYLHGTLFLSHLAMLDGTI